MNCIFQKGGDGTIYSGGYHIHNNDSRIKTMIVPLGLHKTGDDEELIKEPMNYNFVYKENITVLPNQIFDSFISIAEIEKIKRESKSNKTIKKPRKLIKK